MNQEAQNNNKDIVVQANQEGAQEHHDHHDQMHVDEDKTTFKDYVYISLLCLLTYGIMCALYAGLHFYVLYDYYWCFATQMIWFGIFFFSFLIIWHYAYAAATKNDIAKQMIEENLKKQNNE